MLYKTLKDGIRQRTSEGGWWKLVCECGHVYDSGQGVPPLED